MKSMKKIFFTMILLLPVLGQAQEVPHALQQMLTTEAYIDTLKSMVSPETMQNPITMCGSCHEGNELARYQQTLAPMMQMMNPLNWFNLMAYINMMAPMMNPESYELWYNDYMKKYGSVLGIKEQAQGVE
ncbi:MAG: cytochrome c553 [Gammaproteobacteria bacterium]|jgi:cytochrome c553